jgi:hypothetical protein
MYVEGQEEDAGLPSSGLRESDRREWGTETKE